LKNKKLRQNHRYNMLVRNPIRIHWLLVLALMIGLITQSSIASASNPKPMPNQASDVTAFDLIIAMNTLRTSNGLPALVEDPIIDAVAQSTAAIMAANNMSWHIGDVSGRVTAAGYGGGSKVWATENFAMGNMSIDEIMIVWSDPSHMIPAVNPAYCNVGAGVAKASNGFTYYVLQAAYTASKACGEYKSPVGATTTQNGSTNEGRVPGVSQLIVPVKIATPDADGKVFHLVQAGQSFWSIAIAYKITIKDLETWNNLSKDSKLQIGQKLFIPTSNTAGYSTPTPVGGIEISTPDPDGKVIHVVKAYQTLITIAQAYNVKVDTILALNGIQQDWPLQIGQKLVITPSTVTPSATPRPLTPIEKLTPESDGKYYHIIQSGETLSWIADRYEVTLADLMAWNNLDTSSILHPDQKLVLQVTPPATITPTPAPATVTSTPAPVTPSSIPSLTPTATETLPTPTSQPETRPGFTPFAWFIPLGLVLGGWIVYKWMARKKNR
jgi:LysM repeat protein